MEVSKSNSNFTASFLSGSSIATSQVPASSIVPTNVYSSYSVGLDLSKYGFSALLKRDPGYLDSLSALSTGLDHFSQNLYSSKPVHYSDPASTYVPHRKRRENKPRRQRTTFSSDQTLKLEMEYRRSEYVTRTRRLELADDLNLSETQIKIWYQNRRAKDKRIEKAHLDQHIRSMGIGNLPSSVPYSSLTPPLSSLYGWDPWMLRSQLTTSHTTPS